MIKQLTPNKGMHLTGASIMRFAEQTARQPACRRTHQQVVLIVRPALSTREEYPNAR